MKKSLFTAFAVGLGLTANVMAQVPSYVPTNGLVGWWPFNGNANDESGNGNNGTVNGATLTSDRFGNANKAYSFDGVDDEIVMPNTNSLNPLNLTISAWVFVNDINTFYPYYILTKRTSLPTPTEFSYSLHVSTSQGVASHYGIGECNVYGSGSAPETNPGKISPQNWIMVSSTVTSTGECKIFLNGQLDTIINGLPFYSCNSTTTQLQIGSSHSSPPEGRFFGYLDDIAIWNRALTPQEIFDLYNANNCSNDLTINPSVNSLQTVSTANFSATTSDANSTFTWQSDFGQGYVTLNDYGNYSGTNTNVLSISNVQLANHNQPIRAISANANCTDTSNVATIQIADTCITNVTDTTYVTVTDTNVVTVYDTLLTTVTDTLVINTTLSLPAPNNENTILIYPNPASDHITIDNGNYSAMAGYSIKIQNNSGQQVFQSAINQKQFYLDLSKWSGNGLYFVHLIDPQNNTVTVRKIVLQ
jgi:hypothetical protein